LVSSSITALPKSISYVSLSLYKSWLFEYVLQTANKTVTKILIPNPKKRKPNEQSTEPKAKNG
jgi:hypothetical protein